MAFIGASPYPAPKLVELRQAEPLGAIYEHHRGIRYVDTYFDHRSGDQHVQLPVFEPGHHVLFLHQAHATMQQSDGAVRENRR